MHLVNAFLLLTLASVPVCAVADTTGAAGREVYHIAPSAIVRLVGDPRSDSWPSTEVHIIGWDKPIAVLDRALRGDASNNITTMVKQSGNTLEIRTGFHGSPPRRRGLLGLLGVVDWSAASVVYTLHVSANATMQCSVANGDVTVEQVHGPLNLSTSNGNVIARKTGSNIHVRTSNGNIAVSLLKLGLPPTVSLSTSNGNIQLKVPRTFTTQVRASTSNGSIENPFRETTGPGTVVLSTSNGGITVTRE